MARTVLSSNSQFLIKFVLFALTILLALPLQPASSQTIESSRCPTTWFNVIEKIANARNQLPESANGVLFVGFDGTIYNCLDEQVPAAEMKKIRIFESQLAIVFANRRAENPSEERGYCDCGFHTTKSGYGINICHLPYEPIELESDKCALRLELYLRNLKSK